MYLKYHRLTKLFRVKYKLGLIFKLVIAYCTISYLHIFLFPAWQTLFERTPTTGRAELERNRAVYRRGSRYISQSPAKVDNKTEEIAYFLQIQSKSLPLLPRLFNRIYHPENVYIIHFDRDIAREDGLTWLLKSNVVSASNDTTSLLLEERLPANVRVIESEAVNYVGISMTLNTITGMQEALRFSSRWRYFINLSGNDYPLLSQESIRGMLSHTGQSREFFCFEPIRTFWYRFSYMYFDPALYLQNIKKPVSDSWLPNPLAFFSKQYMHKAEAWMIVSRTFTKYIVQSSFARRVLLLFSYSQMAEEMYFVTVAKNSLFTSLTANSCMRNILWHDGNKWSGQHPLYLDDLYTRKYINSNSNNRKWVSQQLTNYTAFFARKFRKPDSKYMDYLDRVRDSNETLSRVTNYFYNELKI